MVTKTINSEAYVLGVTKEKVIQDIYKVVYNLINNNVSDPHSPTRTKWWYPAWPDSDVDNKDSYPIGIINSPELVWDKWTMFKKEVTATVSIEVYSTKTKEVDSLADEVINALEISSIPTLRNVNLRMVNLNSTDSETVIRSKLKIHYRTMNFTMRFTFTRTT